MSAALPDEASMAEAAMAAARDEYRALYGKKIEALTAENAAQAALIETMREALELIATGTRNATAAQIARDALEDADAAMSVEDAARAALTKSETNREQG